MHITDSNQETQFFTRHLLQCFDLAGLFSEILDSNNSTTLLKELKVGRRVGRRVGGWAGGQAGEILMS